MQLGMIGLGRMGGNIVRRLMQRGHTAVVYDSTRRRSRRSPAKARPAPTRSPISSRSCDKPRAVWVMLPAGAITEDTIDELASLLQPGDIIIDGGNTFYQDDVAAREALQAKGIHYLDVGTSGGVWGLERGYCMMIGGDKAVVDRLDPIFATLAPGAATFRARRGARAATRASSTAISTAARPAPGTSSR